MRAKWVIFYFVGVKWSFLRMKYSFEPPLKINLSFPILKLRNIQNKF